MAKFKVAKSASGTNGIAGPGTTVIKDASVGQKVNGSFIGGTGGPHGGVIPTINVTFRVNGITYSNGWILARKGKHSYVVTNGTVTARCSLVNVNAAGLNANYTMTILVTKYDTTTFNAAAIDNKRVVDWTGVKYRYHLSVPTITFAKVDFA